MAATDIQYGGLDPVIYTPDFSFLRYVLDKKNNQYEQGLKSASASYNNLKKELSDPMNAQKRDEYLKSAQSQLQKIASSDLSLQENVNFANSIFEPMATDKAFLIDSYYTAKNKKELAEMDAWQHSDDPEQRRKFNPEIQKWLQRDLDSIKNGNGDVSKYKPEGRSAFAYVDPQEILDKAVKDKGFKYKVDDLGQPYIVTTEGGPGGARNYNVFASEVLGADPLYQQQTAILGQSRQESVLDLYKTDPKLAPIWANAKAEDIYKDYAKNAYNKHKEDEQNYINAQKQNYDKDSAEFDAYTNANADKLAKGQTDAAAGVQSEEAKMYSDHVQKMAELNGLSDQMKDAQKNYDSNYGDAKNLDNYVNSFTKNPTAFFANQQMKNDVTNFTNIKKSSITRTINEDRAYVDIMVAKTNATRLNNDIKDDIQDNLLGEKKLELEEEKLRLKGLKTQINADGTKTIVPLEADIKLVDADITQVGMLNSLNKINDAITVKSGQALNSMVGANGSIGMLENMGMDLTKVGKVRDMFTRYFNQDGTQKKALGMTKEETALLQEVDTKCMAFAKNNSNSDFAQFHTKYAKQGLKIGDIPELLGHAMKGYNVKSRPEFDSMKAMETYNNSLQSINDMDAALKAGKGIVIAAHKNELQKAGMLMKRADGTDDLINGKDISNILSKYSVFKDKDLREQIEKDFENGTLKVDVSYLTTGGSVSVAGGSGLTMGTTGNAPGFSPKQIPTSVITLENGKRFVLNNTQVSIPITSKKYAELNKKLNSEAVIPEFQEKAGSVAASPFYKINGQPKQDIIDTLGHITTTNSQVIEYKDGTAVPGQADEATQKLVRDAIASKDAIAEVTLMTHSPTNKGGQAVQVKFAVDLKSGADKNPLAGRSFFFPITPTEMSRPIFQVFNKAGEISEYEKYKKKGEPYLINTFEGSGIRARMQPLQPGSNEGQIIIEQRKWDPVTKRQSDVWETVGGSNAKLQYNLENTTFPEIKNSIYDTFIYPYVSQNIAYADQAKASGGVTATNIKDTFKLRK